MAWWQTGAMLPLNETNTAAHDVWNRWWHNETDTNDWLPITKHIERCQSMCKEFMHVYSQFKMTDEFRRYDELAIDTFAEIEQVGLRIDTDIFKEKFQTNGIHDNKVYTEYNLYTTTGRPSNKFGGINYAALNKDDGSREAFQSRFEDGFLLEYDYDAFHVRLIADLIKYQLPYESVHTYFGRQYFNKPELSDDEYEQSKQITFRLLYGGIDKEFLEIPFFQKVNDFVYKLWSQCKQKKYIETPVLKRKIYKDSITNITANKLFNYYLQATETEISTVKLQRVLEYLRDKESKLILYTYDSVLLDVNYSEAKQCLPDIINIMQQGNFPVKCKVGDIYSKMNSITL